MSRSGTMLVSGGMVWLAVMACWHPAAGAGPLQMSEGRWRAEVSVVGGSYSGKQGRTDDWYVTAAVEYEIPAYDRLTFGLRVLPLFLYDEQKDDDYGAGTIYGGGFGVTGRIYQHAETRSGWFGELGASALGMSEKLEGNSASVNFLTEIGVGYKFPESGWHVTAKWAHISNAGLGDHNAGTNGVGVAVGYTF